MKIKNWTKYQHYKDRNPPWIKLHRKLLDDRDFHALDPFASKVLVMCWLLAAENDGELPETDEIAFRFRMDEKKVKSAILALNHWIEADSSNMLADRRQDATSETETETETEKSQICAVFDHYFKTFKKSSSYKLTPARKKLIADAIKRHDVEKVMSAIDGMARDDWSERPKFNDLSYAIAIIKKIDNVEKWASYAPTDKKGKYDTEGTDYGKSGIFSL